MAEGAPDLAFQTAALARDAGDTDLARMLFQRCTESLGDGAPNLRQRAVREMSALDTTAGVA